MSDRSNLFHVISPIDQSILLERQYADNQVIEQALQRSEKGFKLWKSVPISERIRVCKKVVEWFEINVEKISLDLTRQMGRPILYAPLEILKGFKERAEYMINIAMDSLGDIEIESSDTFNRFIRKE